MAKYNRNTIYTYVRNAVLEKYPACYVTGTYEPVPPEGLAVRIHEVNHYRPHRYAALDESDEVLRIAWDINVYSNLFTDGHEEVYDVMEVAEEAMRELHFIETECLPVERTNNRVSRLTARFQKMMCEGDALPEGDTQ